MSKRIAVFVTKEELENYFGFKMNEAIPIDPHYNIAPSYMIPVIYRDKGSSEIYVKHSKWGFENSSSPQASLSREKALEGLKSGKYQRCVIPVSGYYKWKEKGKRSKNPFFIRLLSQPVMALAGVFETGNDTNRNRTCAMIETDSNALIQPLDPKMPLQLSKDLSGEWLDPERSAADVLEKGAGQFLLTDMTVLRVSSKVNDLEENRPELIQPLPK